MDRLAAFLLENVRWFIVWLSAAAAAFAVIRFVTGSQTLAVLVGIVCASAATRATASWIAGDRPPAKATLR